MTRLEDLSPNLRTDLRSIRALSLDVDGVLTDGKLVVDSKGQIQQSFHVQDGHGIKELLSNGMEVVIVSGRVSKALMFRAKELGIKHIYQGIADKTSVVDEFCRTTGIGAREIAHVGDDIPDISLFDAVGLSVAVANSTDLVLARADIVLTKSGGEGAVREFCDLLLEVRQE